MNRISMIFAAVLSILAVSRPAADEGMWTFDNLPRQDLEEKYGFAPTGEWLDRLRLASVRISDGGSGSFVSDAGLVMTNHHVMADCIQKLSTPENNLMQNGFYANTLEEERPCPETEINVLVRTRDVTALIGAAQNGAADRGAARKAEVSRIEKEAQSAADIRAQVVSLYNGGQYWLYIYKKYSDVRLVFAPERTAAAFGDDLDNFQFPRYNLDMSFVRVFENGKPITPASHLSWSQEGAKDGELVFVSGHPAKTHRLKTVTELEFARDHGLPALLDGLTNNKQALVEYSAQGQEQARQAAGQIKRIENSVKALTGQLQSLRDPAVWEKKTAEEHKLKKVVVELPSAGQFAGAWETMETIQKSKVEKLNETFFRKIEGSRLYEAAATLVKYAQEIVKPNEQRWPEFRDTNLDTLARRLLSPAPMFPEMEEHLIAASLKLSKRILGDNDPYVKDALGGDAPDAVARDAVAGTKLTDPEYRRQLFEGGEEAIENSDDPLIRLARTAEPHVRREREWSEKNITGPETAASTKLAEARFAAYGTSVYPDATFTLRLSYGKVAGYEEKNGSMIPSKTTFYGLYDRAEAFEHAPPFKLSPKVAGAHENLELSTPLDFVTTNDVIGGNSGSPVVNSKGEVVGLVFDGNIHMLSGAFTYVGERNRTIAVHSRGIIEALDKIYGAGRIVKEISSSGARLLADKLSSKPQAKG